MNIGQFRFQFRCATGMISGLSVSFLLEATLRHHDVGLPGVRVFGEVVRPKCLFVAVNFCPAKSVCAHCGNQQCDNGCSSNLGCALSLVPRVYDASTEECEQRNVCKILEMIGNERAAAHISHSNKTHRWQECENETGNRKKSAARPTIPPMPEASQYADKGDQG